MLCDAELGEAPLDFFPFEQWRNSWLLYYHWVPSFSVLGFLCGLELVHNRIVHQGGHSA